LHFWQVLSWQSGTKRHGKQFQKLVGEFGVKVLTTKTLSAMIISVSKVNQPTRKGLAKRDNMMTHTNELKQIVDNATTAEEILQSVNSASYHSLFTQELRNHFYVIYAQKTVNFFNDDDFTNEEKRESVLLSVKEAVQAHI
jgi:hypothetical protein